MLASRYRQAEKDDVLDTSRGPSALLSRFVTAFLVLGCGVFALVYLPTKSFVAAGVVSGVLLCLSVGSILGHHRNIQRRERRLGKPDAIEVIEIRSVAGLRCRGAGSTGPALLRAAGEPVLLL